MKKRMKITFYYLKRNGVVLSTFYIGKFKVCFESIFSLPEGFDRGSVDLIKRSNYENEGKIIQIDALCEGAFVDSPSFFGKALLLSPLEIYAEKEIVKKVPLFVRFLDFYPKG